MRSVSRWQHLLGLSQLHQLRGRVGRGSLQAYAYLMHPELEQGSKALHRLNAMKELSALGSGFAISQCDLELRGSGNLFGEAQKGSSSRTSVEASQYYEIVKRVAAAPDVSAAAISFANEAEATGVTNATSHWEVPALPEQAALVETAHANASASALAAHPSSSDASAVLVAVPSTSLAAPFLRPPGPTPHVIGGPDNGKDCWWDGAAPPYGCWRRPDGGLHVVVHNAQRTVDRAAKREEQLALKAEQGRLEAEETRLRLAACEQIDAEARRLAIDGPCYGLDEWNAKMLQLGLFDANARASDAAAAARSAADEHTVAKRIAANYASKHARAASDLAHRASISPSMPEHVALFARASVQHATRTLAEERRAIAREEAAYLAARAADLAAEIAAKRAAEMDAACKARAPKLQLLRRLYGFVVTGKDALYFHGAVLNDGVLNTLQPCHPITSVAYWQHVEQQLAMRDGISLEDYTTCLHTRFHDELDAVRKLVDCESFYINAQELVLCIGRQVGLAADWMANRAALCEATLRHLLQNEELIDPFKEDYVHVHDRRLYNTTDDPSIVGVRNSGRLGEPVGGQGFPLFKLRRAYRHWHFVRTVTGSVRFEKKANMSPESIALLEADAAERATLEPLWLAVHQKRVAADASPSAHAGCEPKPLGVYLEDFPSLADEYAMLRRIQLGGGSAPTWDPERCRWYVSDGPSLHRFQEWLPADYLTRPKPPPIVNHMHELGGCDPWSSQRVAKHNKIEKWAESRPAKVKAEEKMEDAALALEAQQAAFSQDLEKVRRDADAEGWLLALIALSRRQVKEAEAELNEWNGRESDEVFSSLWRSAKEAVRKAKALHRLLCGEEAIEDAALLNSQDEALAAASFSTRSKCANYFSMLKSLHSNLEEAEAELAEATRRCECAEEVEKAEQAACEAKTATYVQKYEAHVAIVRERHPQLLRAYHRGKEALVRLSKANALVYSDNKHELLTQLVNADVHGCASQSDARGRPGRCPRCAAKLHLVCSPSDLQPNEPIRLECRNRVFKKGGQTYGGARSSVAPSFERCGWRADITAENKSELLSVRLKDSWQRDLLPVHLLSEQESAGMLVPDDAAQPLQVLEPTLPLPLQEPGRQASSDDMSEDRPDKEEDLELEDEKAQEQEYLERMRRAEVVREAVAGVGWLPQELRELASAAHDRVMDGDLCVRDGEDEEEEAKEDQSEEAQEANARRTARFMSAFDMYFDKRARDFERDE